MMAVFHEISQALDRGQGLTVATIIDDSGSTPRNSGSRMVVFADGRTSGTIGGGAVEGDVIQRALRQFETRGAEIVSYDLSQEAAIDRMDLICGGRIQVLIEHVPVHEHNIDLLLGELSIGRGENAGIERQIGTGLEQGKGVIRVAQAGEEYSYSTQRTCPGCNRGFDEPDPRLFSYNSKHGWCPGCYGTGKELTDFDPEDTGEEGHWLRQDDPVEACSKCRGARLRPEALSIRFAGESIAEIAAMSIDRAIDWFGALQLDARQKAIATDVLAEIRSRLDFLRRVGLGYLTLDRGAPTLSGGEAQRIRLAAQLGSNLRGVCYVLDEPSIGLHPRDNSRLLDMLSALRRQGNTLVVVEHDEEAIRRAEHVIDLGPGGGDDGGRLVAQGTPEEVAKWRRRARAVVVASRFEVFGMVLVEALAQGCPVVGADVGGISEILEHQENGLLFERSNAADLAEKMQTLLDDENLSTKLGEQGRLDMEGRFSRQVVAKQTKALYERALAG